jgi:tetratricopeptide (TPR) repeat protein
MWDEAWEKVTQMRSLLREREFAWRARICVGSGRQKEVVDMPRTSNGKPTYIEVWQALAYAHLDQYDQALQIGRAAVYARQEGAELAFGDICMAMGDYSQALNWYERAALRRGRTPAFRALGTLFMAIGDYHEATFCLKQAIYNSSYLRTADMRRFAECLRRLDRIEEAERAESMVQGRD